MSLLQLTIGTPWANGVDRLHREPDDDAFGVEMGGLIQMNISFMPSTRYEIEINKSRNSPLDAQKQSLHYPVSPAEHTSKSQIRSLFTISSSVSS